MKLSCFELQKPVDIQEGCISTLILENPVFYREFVFDLIRTKNNESDRFTVHDEKLSYDFSKSVEIITDVFNVSFDSRQIATKINQIVSEEFALSDIDSGKILEELNQIAAILTTRLDFDAVYNPICDMKSILKLFGFTVDISGLSYLEIITEYLDFLQRYLNKKLFVLLNLKSSLSDGEYAEFAKLVAYKKFNVLLVENYKRELVSSNETIRIIDTDLCEF